VNFFQLKSNPADLDVSDTTKPTNPNTHKKIPFVIVSAATLFSGGFFYFNNSSADTASQTSPVHQQTNRVVHSANPPSSGTATPSSLAAQPTATLMIKRKK
jgi:hypothetical protein